MGYILDAIIIVVVVLCALIAAKKGFVRSLIEFVGYILAIVIAVGAAGVIADYAYENAVRPVVIEAIDSTLTDSSSNAIEGLPDSVVSLVELAGVDFDSVTASVGETAHEAAVRITDTAVKPITLGLINSIAILLIAIVLFVVVSLVARVLNSMFKGLIFGSANKILGAALGGAKGIIYAAVFSLLVSFIASVSSSDFLFFTEEALEGSYLCKFILDLIAVNF